MATLSEGMEGDGSSMCDSDRVQEIAAACRREQCPLILDEEDGYNGKLWLCVSELLSPGRGPGYLSVCSVFVISC